MRRIENIELIDAIHAYLNDISYGIRLFQKRFKVSNVWDAYCEKKIPKSGRLSDSVNFDFHGIGCFLIFENHNVNFDFGPNGRYDGFDEWRISCFLEEQPNKYPKYLDSEKVHSEFNSLKEFGIIFCPRWEPSRHLYYFKE